MITILHIIQDNKFNSIFQRLDSDDRLKNKKVLILPNKGYKPVYIKDVKDIALLYGDREIKDFFQKENYDAVWFHSLTIDQCYLPGYIPKDKKIVWWAWGWELYESFYGLKPLVEVELFKPLTAKIIVNKKTLKVRAKEMMKMFFLRRYKESIRNDALSRIDYFVPVLPIEYTLLLQNPRFHAEEFFFPEVKNRTTIGVEEKNAMGSILLGNSAAYSMNHVDIIESLRKIDLKDRELIVPLNYGDDGCLNDVENALKNTSFKTRILSDFVPQAEYWELINGCSYAIYGMMRQQAISNVQYCLRRGIKVFMYRDSIPYRFFTSKGAVIYTIEDMTVESLQTPISAQDTIHNRNVLDQIEENRHFLYEKGIEKIQNDLKQR